MSTFKIPISAIPDTAKLKDRRITNFKSKGLSTTTLNYFDLNGSFSLINGLLQKLNWWRKVRLNLDVHVIQLYMFFFPTADIIICYFLNRIQISLQYSLLNFVLSEMHLLDSAIFHYNCVIILRIFLSRNNFS